MSKFIRMREGVLRIRHIDTKAAVRLGHQRLSRGYSIKIDSMWSQFNGLTHGPKAWDALPRVKWPE